MTRVVIVIPVYKEKMTSEERSSLEQCCRILNEYPMTLVCPAHLNISEYLPFFDKYKIKYDYKHFDERYFADIKGYNQLLLNVGFYKSFIDFDYMLIYQLDAFVFKDALEEWCEKGYDYIGSPWFERIWRFNYGDKLRAVGNGGFSLRNIKSCIRVLEHKGKFKPFKTFFSFHNSVILKLLKMPFRDLKMMKFENDVTFFTRINQKTEDQFWGLDTQNSNVDFNVAPIAEGIRFAFECRPSLLYKMNDENLPFGCHAWNKYEPEFWEGIMGNETKIN